MPFFSDGLFLHAEGSNSILSRQKAAPLSWERGEPSGAGSRIGRKLDALPDRAPYSSSLLPRLALAGLFVASCMAAAQSTTPAPFQLLHSVQTRSLGSGTVALSPDGRVLAVFDQDRYRRRQATLRLLDAQTGQVLRTLVGSREFDSALAFSPDGKTLVQVGSQVQAYDAVSGKRLWARSASDSFPSDPVIQFSMDGSQVYVAKLDPSWVRKLMMMDTRTGEVKWDALQPADGTKYTVEDGLYNRVESLALSPDGSTLATGSFGGGIVLRDARTGVRKGTFTDHLTTRSPTQAAKSGITAHFGQVVGLAYLQGGRLISGSNDGTVKLWDTEGRKLAEATVPDGVQTIRLLPDGQGLLVASGMKIVQLNVPDLHVVRVLRGHASRVTSLAVNGDTLWTSSWDGTVKRWNMTTGVDEDTYGTIQEAAVSPDGKMFALNLGDATVRLTDASGNTLRTLRGFLPPQDQRIQTYIDSRSLAFSPDGQTLAAGVVMKYRMTVESYTHQTSAFLWKTGASDLPRVWAGMPGEVLTFSPDGQQLLGISTRDGSVPGYQVRRVSDGKIMAKPCDPVSPDRSKVTGPSCPFVRVRGASWVGQRAQVLTMQNANGPSPTFVRDAVSGKNILSLGKLPENGPAMGVSADGRRIISVAADGLRVFDGKNGKLLQQLPDVKDASPYRNGPILFSPDGHLFTYPNDEVKLHRTVTGEVLGCLTGAGVPITFLKGGRELVTLDDQQGVMVWQLQLPSP